MIRIEVKKTLQAAGGEMELSTNLNIRKGQFIALYGESGAGKTSLLRMIAGLLNPDNGVLQFEDDVWFDSSRKINKSPQLRKIGFVFQDYALFPNMTIRKNIAFADPKNTSGLDELISIFELKNLEDRYPDTLSGGQKQRVALARALIQRPEILMLDEPLSALDHSMRLKLQDYILRVHDEFNLTTILVSHDLAEIFKMADQVIILKDGQVSQFGPPTSVFSDSKVSGKFQFTGEVISVQQEEVVYVITVLIGKYLVKVIADQSDAQDLKVGDKVLVASKAFNPIIRKISD